MPHLWQRQSEIILKIYKNNFFSRKGHSSNCLQSGSDCLVPQVSDIYDSEYDKQDKRLKCRKGQDAFRRLYGGLYGQGIWRDE